MAVDTIEFLSGDLNLSARDADDCTASTTMGNGCRLRLGGTAGVMRFHLLDGNVADLEVNEQTFEPRPWTAQEWGEDYPAIWGGGPSWMSNGHWISAYESQIVAGTVEAWISYRALNGAQKVELIVDGQTVDSETYGCTTLAHGYPSCADHNGLAKLHWSTAVRPEGAYRVAVAVTGANGHRTVGLERLVFVDNAPPYITASGGLYDARTRESVTDASVLANATDIGGSGVRAVKLDEQINGSWYDRADNTRVCTTTCPSTPLAASFTLDPVALNWTTGQRNLRLTALDGAYNNSRLSWSIQYYKGSWTQGGVDHIVSTPSEISAVRATIEGQGSSGNAGYWADFSPSDHARLFPTSYVSGGADHVISTSTELADVRAAFESDDSDPRSETRWNEALPADRYRLYPASWDYGGSDHVVSTQSERDAVRSASSSADRWERLRPADRARVYYTSWTFGGSDHLLTTAQELATAWAYLQGVSDPQAMDRFWAGLFADDLNRVIAAEPAPAPPPPPPPPTGPTQAEAAGDESAPQPQAGTTSAATGTDLAPVQSSGGAVASAVRWRCRSVPNYLSLKIGWVHVSQRFCYNKTARRAIYGNVNTAWVEKKGSIIYIPWSFGIVTEAKDEYLADTAGTEVVQNYVSFRVCAVGIPWGPACADRVALFRIRGHWDGTVKVRVDTSTWDLPAI